MTTHQEHPNATFAVPFTVGDGLVLTAWSIVAQVVVAVPFAAAGVEFDSGPVSLLILALMQLVTFAGVVAWLRSRDAWGWSAAGPERPEGRHVAIGVGVGLVGFLVVAVLSAVADQLFGPLQPPEQAVLRTSLQGGLSAGLALLVAGILGPIIEELVFRGILFQALRHRLGVYPAVTMSAIVFTVVHIEVFNSPVALGGLLVLGIWLALVFHRTGSLVVPIVGHMVFNGVALVLALAASSLPA